METKFQDYRKKIQQEKKKKTKISEEEHQSNLVSPSWYTPFSFRKQFSPYPTRQFPATHSRKRTLSFITTVQRFQWEKIEKVNSGKEECRKNCQGLHLSAKCSVMLKENYHKLKDKCMRYVYYTGRDSNLNSLQPKVRLSEVYSRTIVVTLMFFSNFEQKCPR